MLYGATFECEMPATLIAGRLAPMSFDLAAVRDAETSWKRSANDIATVRHAIDTGRYPAERVIDRVVDRLLEELTW